MFHDCYYLSLKATGTVYFTFTAFYELPLVMEEKGLAKTACKKLGIEDREIDLTPWKEVVDKIKNPKERIRLAVVGKYVELKDAYISVNEAIENAAYAQGCKAEIDYIQAENLDVKRLEGYNGILVPGGFGNRGIEGKMEAIKFARENKIPFLGICLGMQLAVIEFARNVMGMSGANSTEFDKDTKYPVIDIMIDQKNIENMGGTMRLGAYPCVLKEGTLARELYNEELIYERHRHRFEFNNKFKDEIQKAGLLISGNSPDGTLAEIVELSKEVHPFFIAGQFHPEFKTRPNNPHPLFKGFVEAIYKKQYNK